MDTPKQPQRKFDLLPYFEAINRPKVVLSLLVMQAVATGVVASLMYFSENYLTTLIHSIFFLSTIVLIVTHLIGRKDISLVGLLTIFPIMLTISIVQGQGMHDIGILGFVIYIVFASLLMGKRFLPIAWVLSVLSAGFVYLSERYHFMPFEQNYQIQADYIDLVIIVIFLTITTCIFWIVMNVIEKTILRVLSSERRVKDAYDLTLEGWARALEMRDKETEGHSRRVTELTMKIGRQMAFSEEELIHVRRGALLHDIGKMAIPDSILHKPGELTEEEWTLVRKHPLQAYEMLKDIDFLEQAMDIPLYHHEQWDGNGYPYGLAGEEIPLPARIFAVVDNWDALCSDRAYRPAWEREEAISYIKEQAGKKFDPEVTKVFLRVI